MKRLIVHIIGSNLKYLNPLLIISVSLLSIQYRIKCPSYDTRKISFIRVQY